MHVIGGYLPTKTILSLPRPSRMIGGFYALGAGLDHGDLRRRVRTFQLRTVQRRRRGSGKFALAAAQTLQAY